MDNILDKVQKDAKGERLCYNFVEIGRLPRKFDARALTSIIVSASRIVPCSTDSCIRTDSYGIEEQVALVKFKTEHDAYKAVEKMKLNHTFKSWSMKLITDPDLTNPEAEALRKWLN